MFGCPTIHSAVHSIRVTIIIIVTHIFLFPPHDTIYIIIDRYTVIFLLFSRAPNVTPPLETCREHACMAFMSTS